MYSTSDFKRGLKIELEGEPYTIVEFQHVKPGKGGAFVRTKLKNLTTKRVIDKTFRSGEKVGKPDLAEEKMEFLYLQDDQYHFMNTEDYEQTHLNGEDLGDAVKFLKEGMEVAILFHNGKAIDVELPTFVELKITKTEPGVKGDTVSGSTKPAVLETGATVLVPLFIEEGETIKIDTRTGEYVERVK